MENRILIYADEPGEWQGFMQRHAGLCETYVLESNDSNLKKCEAFKPHVILLAFEFPKLAFLERFFQLRKRNGCRAPIILAVGQNMLAVERFARAQGIFYYMVMPVNPEELAEAMHAALEHSSFTDLQEAHHPWKGKT